MNQHAANPQSPQADATTVTDDGHLDQWRDEIRAFYRETAQGIERVVRQIEESAAADERRRSAVEYRPAQLRSTTVSSDSYRDDRDSSHDRLAILKRELAAKLSNTNRDDTRAGAGDGA